MASRRGRTGGEKKSGRRERENERREGARESRGEGAEERREDEEEERENARVEAEGRQTNFRQFVNDLKTKQHRVVEMRIALVCSFAVVARVLFSNQLSDEHSSVIQSSLLFAGICVAVIIFSTYLDYFPSKLVDIRPRESESQGMPLACLLLPMVCCAAVHSALYNATHLLGILSLYLTVLCVLNICSLVATLMHPIPYPNSILFYNFAVLVLAYVFHQYLEVHFWLLLACMVVYSVLIGWLVHCFPLSFTLGEAMIVGQGVTLMVIDTGLQLLQMYGLVSLPPWLTVPRSVSILYLEFLLSGVILCSLLLSPALYKISLARHYHERKFWSGSFLLLSASIIVMLVLPWLRDQLGGENAIAFILFFLFRSPIRLVLLVFWLMLSVATMILVWAQSSKAMWAAALKAKKPSSVWMRKWFHLLALLVYLPGVALDPDFLGLMASLVAFVFVVIELVRLMRLWPVGEALNRGFRPLLDSRDAGPLVVTHFYLLLGFSLPIWLYPLRDYYKPSKLGMYSGVLALGIGDSMAAIAGKLIGRFKWPGTKKTVEGTLMSVMTQLLGVLLIVLIDPHLSFFSASQWGIIAASLMVTALLEAYTWQIDNLIIGLFQFAFFLSFL